MMQVMKEKTDWMLEVKRVYCYQVFLNGRDEISIEVQYSDNFHAIRTDGMALVSVPQEIYKQLSPSKVNLIFQELKAKLDPDWSWHGELDAKGHIKEFDD